MSGLLPPSHHGVFSSIFFLLLTAFSGVILKSEVLLDPSGWRNREYAQQEELRSIAAEDWGKGLLSWKRLRNDIKNLPDDFPQNAQRSQLHRTEKERQQKSHLILSCYYLYSFMMVVAKWTEGSGRHIYIASQINIPWKTLFRSKSATYDLPNRKLQHDELCAPLLLYLPFSKPKATKRWTSLNTCKVIQTAFYTKYLLQIGREVDNLFKMSKRTVLILTENAICKIHWPG